MLLMACASSKLAAEQYRVQPGDTLSKVAQSNNRRVTELKRWNNLSDANVINVGQVLRVAPLDNDGMSASSATDKKTSTAKKTTKKNTASGSSSNAAVKASLSSGFLAWPAAGSLAKKFNGSNTNGILIANAAGTPVTAAASGSVAYAGSGLRGYGNLVIIKHNASVLTIYAHNRSLLVKEGQAVKQGQKIAEMGDRDSKQVGLYFEIRQNGQPVDPIRSLPNR